MVQSQKKLQKKIGKLDADHDKDNNDVDGLLKDLGLKRKTIQEEAKKGEKAKNELMQIVTLLPTRKNIIKKLIAACPEMASTVDKKDRTALHYGAMHEASTEVMKLLVNANPDAVFQKDKEGNTPLHLALKCGRVAVGPLQQIWMKYPMVLLMDDAPDGGSDSGGGSGDHNTPLGLCTGKRVPIALTTALSDATLSAINTFQNIQLASKLKMKPPTIHKKESHTKDASAKSIDISAFKGYNDNEHEDNDSEDSDDSDDSDEEESKHTNDDRSFDSNQVYYA